MVDNEFFRTADSSYATLPANTAFDIAFVDPTQVKIYDARPERFRTIQGAGVDRNWYLEGEHWFVPVCWPTRKVVNGTVKFYKAVGEIQAIAKA